MSSSYTIVLLLSLLSSAMCKIYTTCELARELRNKHGVQLPDLGTWVCIAKYESEYNTAARNTQSGDHGIFQISELYWCSPPGKGCGVSCNKLRDDDITDDFRCAKIVYQETKKLNRDGFSAWVMYSKCKNRQETNNLVKGCF